MVTLHFLNEDKQIVSCRFAVSDKIDRSVWNTDTNQVLLTRDEWKHFRTSRGNAAAIRKLLDKCLKVSKTELK